MINWILALLRRSPKQPPETGYRWKRPQRRPIRNPNATGDMVIKEFMDEVAYRAHESYCNVIIYESWSPWFRNEEWRKAALKALEGCPFLKPGTATFSGPCWLDSGWVFSAYVIDRRPIEDYTLDESMP